MYQGTSVEDITRRYIKALDSCPSVRNSLHSLALHRYLNYLRSQTFIRRFKSEVKTVDSILQLNYPKLKRILKGRFKSLVSVENKINRKLDMGESIDTLQDILAFRIIVDQDNCSPEELLVLCYAIANDLISFYVSKGYYLCTAEPVVDTIEDNSPILKKIHIPKESGIEPLYLSGCKDYIRFPKKNGYQSIHLLFRSPAGFTFEVQLRTKPMDDFAEEGYAVHGVYKESKYPNALDFDRKKINIEGFSVSPNGKVIDTVGLEFAKELFFYDSLTSI